MPGTDFSSEIKELESDIKSTDKDWGKVYPQFTKLWQQVQTVSDNGKFSTAISIMEEQAKVIQDFVDETDAKKKEHKTKGAQLKKLVKDNKPVDDLNAEVLALSWEIDKERPKKEKELRADMKKFHDRYKEIVKQVDGYSKSTLKLEKEADRCNEMMDYCDARYDELVNEIKTALGKNKGHAGLEAQKKQLEKLRSEVRKLNQQKPQVLEYIQARDFIKSGEDKDVTKRLKALKAYL